MTARSRGREVKQNKHKDVDQFIIERISIFIAQKIIVHSTTTPFMTEME